MAFIDIETREAGFRVVLTSHGLKIPKEIIPKSTQAILVEGNDDRRDSIRLMVATGGFPERGLWPYREIVAESERREIPVVAIEPFATLEGIAKGYQRVYLANFLQSVLEKVGIKEFGQPSKNVSMNDPIFRRMELLARLHEMIMPEIQIESKNLLWAERAHVFAGILNEGGIPTLRNEVAKPHDHPNQLLVTGALHLGIVRKLQMSKDERLRAISRKSKNVKGFYDPSKLGVFIYSVGSKRRPAKGMVQEIVYDDFDQYLGI